MKRLVIISTLIFIATITAFSQAENVAKEVLNAYKNKDVELLKKNASGILKMAITKAYFDDKSIQEDARTVDRWDGTIKEVRYASDNIMGRKTVMATAYYAGGGKDQIYAVLLSSMDNGKNWVMVGSGLVSFRKERI